MQIYFINSLMIFDLEPGRVTDKYKLIHKTEDGDIVLQSRRHALIVSPYWSQSYQVESKRREANRILNEANKTQQA